MSPTWQTIAIKDLGRVVTGRTPSSNNPGHFGEGYPFITPSDIALDNRNIETERFVSEEGKESLERILLPKGSICFVCIGATIGKICMTSRPSFTNQQINSVVVDESKHDSRFAFYALTRQGGNAKALAGGAATPIINKSAFSEIELDLPDLPTQRKIAGILSAYDDLIENNLRRIKILEQMAQSLYREWFVHFRFPGHESATYKDSELGRIPEGWEVKAASDISQITIGKTPPRKESQWFTNSTEGIPWISIRDMNQGRFVLNTSEGLTGEAVSKFNVKRVPDGTVLLSFKLTVGKVCVTVGEMLTNEAIAHFHLPNGSAITPAYLLAYLSNFEFETLGSTSSIGRATNSQVIKKMPILVPPKGILSDFNKLAEPSYSSVRSMMQRNQTLRRTRDLLLPKLLSATPSGRSPIPANS